MKRAYTQISYHKRCEIIRQICYRKCKINEVSSNLKINVSTIKAIIQKFKKQGVLFARSKGNYQRQVNQQDCFHSCTYNLSKKIIKEDVMKPDRSFFTSYAKINSSYTANNFTQNNSNNYYFSQNNLAEKQIKVEYCKPTNENCLGKQNLEHQLNLLKNINFIQQQFRQAELCKTMLLQTMRPIQPITNL